MSSLKGENREHEPGHRNVAKQIFYATTIFQNEEQKLAKKSKRKITRRAYSKADVRELRAHSKQEHLSTRLQSSPREPWALYARRRLNLALVSVISAIREATHSPNAPHRP